MAGFTFVADFPRAGVSAVSPDHRALGVVRAHGRFELLVIQLENDQGRTPQYSVGAKYTGLDSLNISPHDQISAAINGGPGETDG